MYIHTYTHAYTHTHPSENLLSTVTTSHDFFLLVKVKKLLHKFICCESHSLRGNTADVVQR